ncbi:MAG TPA: hemolytic protein HlpA [Exiguobacterium sp.]|uniref:hypothetical protein n=1 Tax=Exiguobacterium sp. TaxID=44751 RepID=UPI000ED5F724|nr:hypothetical protein [Exiguobacterium sp.]HCN57741.1 hemolytic protein HlpA [Exiguobacterium sp.]
MKKFEIPIVLFTFKRTDKTIQIIKRISEIKPMKLYILSDEGRNEDEKKQVKECREAIENAINWDCEVVLNYAKENKGVYENIGEGAKWVLEREENAIFLEDDNLPEVTFFEYCKELLQKYKEEKKILWICGTNYLEDTTQNTEYSYYFTKHLLPCGWATWSWKFLEFYDGELNTIQKRKTKKFRELKTKYENKKLYEQQKNSLLSELERKEDNLKFNSWDYQMAYSLRINNLYGISPVVNQIKNIGVDNNSIHGGNSFDDEMTRRFCGIETKPLTFPLKSPEVIKEDQFYERKVAEIILYPLEMRIKNKIVSYLKKILKIKRNESIKDKFRRKYE